MNEIEQLREDVNTQFYQFGEVLAKQGTFLKDVNTTLKDIKTAIQDITTVARTQEKHKEKIKNINDYSEREVKRIDKNIDNIYNILGETKCPSHEARIQYIEERVKENRETDKTQDSRFFGILQQIIIAILAAGLGAVGAYIIK